MGHFDRGGVGGERAMDSCLLQVGEIGEREGRLDRAGDCGEARAGTPHFAGWCSN